MSSNLEKYKSDLAALIKLGSRMGHDLSYHHLGEEKDLDKKDSKIAKEL